MTEKEKALIEAKANILKALGHPTRLWMAEQLAGGEKCVCELAENINADFSTVSKHLTVLKQAGVVEVDKRGKQVYYRLKVPCILNFMPCVEAVLQATAQSHIELMDQKRPIGQIDAV
ncbi:MAG: metalloregulator ArsR/SmtB family transcription factor [Desulfoprunum sp.]|jgi:ArsR family transcriptional regulator|uniref:ArsR/SmtB family transcription factor n=1 Tax=Desulfoprunum sp. TaxID=2020866 RepID=UPI000690D43C